MTPEEFNSLGAEFHEKHMKMAFAAAEKGVEAGEIPAGCVIVSVASGLGGHGSIIGKAHNMTESLKDPTAHAEVLAITQAAAAVGDWRIVDSILYVTKEPCPMCGGAIVLARVPYVVWAVDDPKRGADTVFGVFKNPGINHHPQIVTGVMRDECLAQLQAFFRARRKAGSATDDQDDANRGSPG